MIWVAIGLASAGVSIACGVTLPAADDAVVEQNDTDPSDDHSASTLGGTLPAPHSGDSSVPVQQQQQQPQGDGGPAPGTGPFPTTRWYAVFVTSDKWTADGIGGLSGADQKCLDLAEKTTWAKSKKWAAWLSDGSKSAASRLGTTPGPWIKVNAVRVADTRAQLLDTTALISAIDMDERGSLLNAFYEYVWTGTLANGTSSNQTCQSWTGTQGQGVYGILANTKPDWTNKSDVACEWNQYWGGGYQSSKPKNHLYCFEIDP